MLCCVFWLVSPKCLSGKFLRCVNVSALVSTWMVRYAISSNYSKMLNSAQMNYTTIDNELLCVVATLQELHSMLLGAELHVYHMNILNIGDSSQRQLRWISYVDEYGPELHYVEGPLNVIVDTFSRLSGNDVSSPLVGKKATNVVSNSEIDNEYD